MTSNFDLQHSNAFGVHTGISRQCRDSIIGIKDNSEHLQSFELYPHNAAQFSDLAWQLLGRYIANNTHLDDINLNHCGITDEIMALLFEGLTRSASLTSLRLSQNEFGIEGLRSMIQFLQNSPLLKSLWFNLPDTQIFNTKCFDLIIRSLNGTFIQNLCFVRCNITDISALESCNLPNLGILSLIGNKIGRDGCLVLSNLLRQEDTVLTHLYLQNTGIDDEGAKTIANSLQENTQLEGLTLEDNDITEEGRRAFLKLLVDISSMESIYTSNHTLDTCRLIYEDDGEDEDMNEDTNEIQSLINSACTANINSTGNPGRAKVIKYQLNSQKRKELCQLQGIEYSYSNIFADIEPVLLPKILALISSEHGQSELYTALIPTAPDLLSYIDKKAMLNDTLAKNTAHANALNEEKAAFLAKYEREMACLTAHNTDIHRRLELVELGDTKQLRNKEDTKQDERDKGGRSNKRQRS